MYLLKVITVFDQNFNCTMYIPFKIHALRVDWNYIDLFTNIQSRDTWVRVNFSESNYQ